MQNFSATNQERRYKAYVGALGIAQLHKHNPFIVAWWSAALPGFGHILLSKHLRGLIIFLWEILINVQSNLNLAMVYSFNGHIEMAMEAIDTRWILLYIPVYMFTIWDGYRSAVDINHQYLLAEHENAPFPTYNMNAVEINYLDKKIPFMAVFWSFVAPGLGHLYIHRVLVAFFMLFWFIAIVYFSGVSVAVHHLFLGQISQATEVLDPLWTLFLPSLLGFVVYDAYVHTVEANKLFESVQRNLLKDHYQTYRVKIPES